VGAQLAGMTACVGIVGGLGVGATVHYYEKITAACKARGFSPDLMIAHADVDHGQGMVRAGKLDALADYLATFIDRLGRAGAEAAVLPAVTPHICIAQLKQRARLPIINIVDPIKGELQARQIKRVALFGTIFTMQGSFWGQLAGAEIVKPGPTRWTSLAEPTSASSTRRRATPMTPPVSAASPAICSAATAWRRSCSPAPILP
jgi:aspartate racemase